MRSRSFWARQPPTTICMSGRRCLSALSWPRLPYNLLSAFSRMQQVLSTTTSASSTLAAGRNPSASSRPAIRSESCSFIWHPKVRTRYRDTPDSLAMGANATAAAYTRLSRDEENERSAEGAAVRRAAHHGGRDRHDEHGADHGPDDAAPVELVLVTDVEQRGEDPVADERPDQAEDRRQHPRLPPLHVLEGVVGDEGPAEGTCDEPEDDCGDEASDVHVSSRGVRELSGNPMRTVTPGPVTGNGRGGHPATPWRPVGRAPGPRHYDLRRWVDDRDPRRRARRGRERPGDGADPGPATGPGPGRRWGGGRADGRCHEHPGVPGPVRS